MSLNLQKNLADLKKEVETASEELNRKRVILAEQMITDAFENFKTHMQNNTFEISETDSYEEINNKQHLARTMLANYNGLNYSLSAPKEFYLYMGAINILDLNSPKEKYVVLLKTIKDYHPATITHAAPKDAEEELKIAILKTEIQLKSIKNELSEGIVLGFAYKNTKNKWLTFENFNDILKELIK